jgi:hypothetical protein
MNKKRFISQQSGNSTIKIFNAETGQLFKVITITGSITSPPICTEDEMYVGVKGADGVNALHYYNIPSFNLKLKVTI